MVPETYRQSSLKLGFVLFQVTINKKNMVDSEKLQSLKSQIKTLEQKKTTLTDAAEIKAINKRINALQEEFGRLRKEIQYQRSYEKSVEREFVHCVVGDE